MGKVIPFSGVTNLDLEADVVLENTKGQLEGFVICGYTKDGEEYFASTYSDGKEAMWLLERCKRELLKVCDGFE
jgi:hypothetical protein